jgi:hypothetical protein
MKMPPQEGRLFVLWPTVIGLAPALTVFFADQAGSGTAQHNIENRPIVVDSR